MSGEPAQVLVLNAGSSTLKYQLLDGERVVSSGTVERVRDMGAACHEMADRLHRDDTALADVDAIGHRVVHGGPELTRPVLIDDEVVATIEELSVLAPLHNPGAVAGIRAARALVPHVPHVACFDTAFFAGLPAAASTYAIDRDLARRERVRRYGFHGLSHEYVAGQAAAFLGRPLAELALVTLHLGNGASAAAIDGGRPVDTSMGMTPLEGLVMGTRAGDLDPGVVLHLERHAGLSTDDVQDLLNKGSGLRGLAGLADFRDVLAGAEAGDEGALLAYAVYCHRLRKYVGAYAAVLGRLDAIVFTAGVGQHAARLRADALAGLGLLGIEVDGAVNERVRGDEPARISPEGAGVEVLVVPTNEELAIARQLRALLRGSDGR
jgi:acetate kinase